MTNYSASQKYTLHYVDEAYERKVLHTDKLNDVPREVKAWRITNNKTKVFTQSPNFVVTWQNSNKS